MFNPQFRRPALLLQLRRHVSRHPVEEQDVPARVLVLPPHPLPWGRSLRQRSGTVLETRLEGAVVDVGGALEGGGFGKNVRPRPDDDSEGHGEDHGHGVWTLILSTKVCQPKKLQSVNTCDESGTFS